MTMFYDVAGSGCFLFSYFTGESDGLRLAGRPDGYNWEDVGKRIAVPELHRHCP